MAPAADRAEGLIAISQLVDAFTANLDFYKSNAYAETAARSQFIDPLSEALGWDVVDEAGQGPRREVVVESAQRAEPSIAG